MYIIRNYRGWGILEITKSEAVKKRRKRNITHVNRIIGQLNALKKLMDSGGACYEISSLVLSIKNSTNSLGVRVLEGFVLYSMLDGDIEQIDEKKMQQFERIINLYR